MLSSVESVLTTGADLILEVDWQGARLIRNKVKSSVSIFILPPSLGALEARLRQRAADPEHVLLQRVREAKEDIAHVCEAEYVIVNDVFETALELFRSVIMAERCKTQFLALPQLE